jgi:hypothetical protein
LQQAMELFRKVWVAQVQPSERVVPLVGPLREILCVV